MRTKTFLNVEEIIFFDSESNAPIATEWTGDPGSSLSTLRIIHEQARTVHEAPAALFHPLMKQPFGNPKQLELVLDAVQTRLPSGVTIRVRVEAVMVCEGERVQAEVAPSLILP